MKALFNWTKKEMSSPTVVYVYQMHSSAVVVLVSARCHPGPGTPLLDKMYIVPTAQGNVDILNWLLGTIVSRIVISEIGIKLPLNE